MMEPQNESGEEEIMGSEGEKYGAAVTHQGVEEIRRWRMGAADAIWRDRCDFLKNLPLIVSYVDGKSVDDYQHLPNDPMFAQYAEGWTDASIPQLVYDYRGATNSADDFCVKMHMCPYNLEHVRLWLRHDAVWHDYILYKKIFARIAYVLRKSLDKPQMVHWYKDAYLESLFCSFKVLKSLRTGEVLRFTRGPIREEIELAREGSDGGFIRMWEANISHALLLQLRDEIWHGIGQDVFTKLIEEARKKDEKESQWLEKGLEYFKLLRRGLDLLGGAIGN